MKRIISLVIGLLFCGILVTYGVTQETPVGRVTGKLTMKENGRPLAGEDVTLEAAWTGDDSPDSRGVETEEDGSFSFRGVPAGSYYIRATTRSHRVKDFVIFVNEAKETAVNLAAEPDDPYLQLYCSQKVFTSDEKPKIELHGFLPNSSDVRIGLYKVSLNQIEKAGSLNQVLSPISQEDPGDLKKLEDSCEHIRDLAHPVKKVDAEGTFIENIDVGELTTGVYFIDCSADKQRAGTAIYVSNLGLITKTYGGKMLAYTSHLKTGKPVGDAAVSLINNGKLQMVGKTNKDGLLDVNLPKTADYHALVVAQTQDSVAFIGYRDQRLDNEKNRIVGYCERPAYRPGDEINFKGIVRQKAADGYTLPKPGLVDVKIKDADDNVMETHKLRMNSHGAFFGKFSTSKEGKPGSYQVECAYAGSKGSIYANVVAYRKPEYSIEVTPDKPFYTMGDEASATIECKYYYGGPVVGAKVKASIYRSAVWRYDGDEIDEEEEDGGRYSYYSRAGEYSEEVEAVTDATGRATIKFPTRASDDPDYFDNDYNYQVSASVTEDGSKYFDGQGEVMVVRGEHNLQIQVMNPLLAPGDTMDLLVKTTDPTKHTIPVPNQAVTIELGHETWTRRNSVFIGQKTIQVTTGADGTVHVPIPITKADSVVVRATSKDKRGNRVSDQTYAYVEGSPAMFEREKGKIDITLDKRKYVDGDTAKALIQTDMPGGSALVTVESAGIISRQIVPITSESTMVKVPIQQEFSPNVYVSVAYVQAKKFLESSRRIDVSRKDRDLRVEVKCDKPTYKPGETALVSLKTTDSTGKPCGADVSVGVVDEGIYDIAPDDTDLKHDFYPRRSNDVETSFSFPEIYLDGGDKGTSKIPLRKTFRDTAQWNPSVWTGANGEAQVRVRLPDNLTQWRVTAVGVSDQTSVGMTTEKFRAKKDLMVRLELPQYLVSGDHQRMTMVIANDTGKDQDVHIQSEVSGAALDKATPNTVHVPNGKPQTIECEITAGDPGNGTVTARAWIDGGPTDGVQQSFPIEPHGRPVLVSQAGEGTTSFSLPLRKTSDPKFGDLTITLSPTIAGDLLSSLDELIDFPYGCVEQTMSRFMPSVLVDRTVRELGLTRPKKLDQLPKIVRDSLARLDNMRHRDGGFGWWEYDSSDPFMTALVLDGVDRAKQAGQDVSFLNLDSALDWGIKWLEAKGTTTDRWIDRDKYYLIYSLLRWGKKDAAKYLKDVKLDKLDAGALAQIAMAFHEAGNDGQANTALGLLSSKAQGTDVAYWSQAEGYWGAELTATALVAYTTIRPTDSIVPRIVHYLRVNKRGDMWYSTRDTAYVLVGLTNYLRGTKELSGESKVDVLVNGKPVRTVQLNPKVLNDRNWTVSVPRKDLGAGDVKIQIHSSGPGRCYYSAQMRSLDVDSLLRPESSDPAISVERAYYKLEPRRLMNGTMKLMPSEKPVDSFQSGDLIRVELTFKVKEFRQFVLIDEPVPSSCHVQERDEIGPYENWGYWWSRTVIRDDRLAFFCTELPIGENKIAYTLRAEQSGKVRVLPTTVGNMYDPSHTVSTAENTIEVRP